MTHALKSFEPSGFQFAWDATSVSAYERCPRYYQLKILEGWQSARLSEHLTFGKVYASALEHFAKHIAEGATYDEATNLVVHEAMIETWEHDRDEQGFRIAGTGGEWVSTHSSKNRETLIRSLIWYLENFKDDPLPVVILAEGKPAVEHSFSLELTNNLLYCGHIDKLVTYSGGTYVMDQKTSGATLSSYYFDGFKPDIQMGGYTWAGKIIFNLPVAGVVIDAAQIAVGFTKFQRGFVTYPEPLLAEWHDQTLRTIERAKQSHASGVYEMCRGSCGNYGGCEFRKVCSRIPQHREAVLHAEFVRRPRWDPLERR